MRAAVFYGKGDVRVVERDTPNPGQGEVLLKITGAGICGGDVAQYRAPTVMPLERAHPASHHRGPLVLGHEFAGEIVDVGPGVQEASVGKIVVCGAGVSCGKCRACLKGRRNLCESYYTLGFHRDGGLAEYAAVPAAICVDIAPFGMSPDRAALAQPTAIAVHAIRRSRVTAGERVAVIGAGGVGVFLAYAAAELGAEVTVLDLQQERLEIASRLGVSRVIDTTGMSADDIKGILPSQDVVYEVSGTSGGFATALEIAGAGTRTTIVGVQANPQTIDMQAFVAREQELIATVAHICDDDLPEALRLLATRGEPWSDVAPVALPLEHVVDEGLIPMSEGRGRRIKTLIDPRTDAPRAANIT